MPRPPRCDRPGRWFHVYNRGIARRPVFETRADIRFFLACLARAVRRGELEVHAYCILTTHFHLLVRSPTGSLSEAMRRVLNAYVRYYNRARRRDGALFRGRYGARPVDSLAYRRILVRYIDRNSVAARLSRTPWEYPYGSAWHYVQPRRPRWLTCGWVDREVLARGFSSAQEGYRPVFGRRWTESEEGLVRGRMEGTATREEVLDDLIDAAPPAVLAWMQRKAKLADGGPLTTPCVDAATVLRVLEEERSSRPTWTMRTAGGQTRDAWRVVEAYLLRSLAALRWIDIGRSWGMGPVPAARRAAQARELLGRDPVFAARISELARRALTRVHGPAA